MVLQFQTKLSNQQWFYNSKPNSLAPRNHFRLISAGIVQAHVTSQFTYIYSMIPWRNTADDEYWMIQ